MKIIYPTNKPNVAVFKDIPTGMIFSAGGGALYRKLANGNVYSIRDCTIVSCGEKVKFWDYFPYPNATLILEPQEEVKR